MEEVEGYPIFIQSGLRAGTPRNTVKCVKFLSGQVQQPMMKEMGQ